jgi:FkbM family methyltransferase
MSADAVFADSFCELHAGDTSYRICLPHADRDYIQGKILKEQQPYELAMLEDMRTRVKAGDLFVDVGANVGNHSLFMAVIGECQVVSFEPNAELCEALRASAEANGITKRVRIERYAVGAEATRGRFAKERPDNLGAQSIEVGDGDIDVISLDAYSFERAVKVLKIDVEGMELDVLRGAKTLIERDRPLVYVECLDESQYKQVSAVFAEWGYGYWDTFNASPTQLFLPNERSTLDQRFARLHAMIEESNYRKGYKLNETRHMLDESNRKYRFANEQIAQFKTQIVELTAEKKILETNLSALKQRVDNAVEQRDGVDREAVALQAKLDESLAALSSTRADVERLQERCAAQNDQLSENRHKLSLANALADQMKSHSASRLEDWQHWEAETRARCDAEIVHLKDEARSLRAELDNARTLHNAARSDCERLQGSLSLLDDRQKSNEKERLELSDELKILRAENDRLNIRIEALKAEQSVQLASARQVKEAFERERSADQIALADLRADKDSQDERIRQIVTELTVLAETSSRDGAGLRDEIARLRAVEAENEKSLTSLIEESEAMDRKYRAVEGSLIQDLNSARAQLSDSHSRIAELGEALSALDSSNQAREASLVSMLDDCRAKQVEAEAHARQLTDEMHDLEAALQQKQTDLSLKVDRLEVEKEEGAREAARLSEVLTAAREEVQTLAARVVHNDDECLRLSSELTVAQAKNKTQASSLDLIKLDAVRNKLAITEANAQIERLRQQLFLANQQVMRTRNTLSFQLGYALIFGTKSFAEFRALPGKLWGIHKQAKERRVAREAKSGGTTQSAKFRAAAHRDASSAASNAEDAHLIADMARERLKGMHTDDGATFARHLKSLKVGAIMDEFTHASYESECNLLQLTPARWREELDSFSPDILFIESAWRGKDALWGNKVGHMSQEVVSILQWCRDHKVPTIFWNKEDPVHFETFLSTAKRFDFVFTTDIDCIHRYKAALGHERVYLLPFAAQPRANSPIEKYQRKDAFCFAGAYYTRYPERTRDLGNFIVTLPEFRPFEIFDRNYGKADPNYRFPDEYQSFIVGNLPYAEIDKAYKGYRYAVNLNSVKQSQSMFARRVYELLASNTITVSNFSRGLRLMFGDLVLTSDSGAEIKRRLTELCSDDTNMRKLRLAALRKVMMEHTYEDRLAYLVAKVSEAALPSLLPPIVVTAYAKDQQQADRILNAFGRQRYSHKTLVLVVPVGISLSGVPEDGSVRILSAAESDSISLSTIGSTSAWLCAFVPDDYYGEHYLTDLALATRYSDATIIGKAAHYVWSDSSGVTLKFAERAYRTVSTVPARAGMTRLDALPAVTLREWVRGLYTAKFDAHEALSIDEFNYCRSGFNADQAALSIVGDIVGIRHGVSLKEILGRAEAIEPERQSITSTPQLNSKELADLFSQEPANSQVSMVESDGFLRIDSTLPDGKHEYWYAKRDHELAALGVEDRTLRLHVDVTPGLNLQLVVLFLDSRKQKITHAIKACNRNQEVEVPDGTSFVRLGLRVYAAGSAQVRACLLGSKDLTPAPVFAQARTLVLTNHYPAYEDLYRNGFVHSRVRAYRQRGVLCDVFRLRPEEQTTFGEFENIDVVTGGQEVLNELLGSGKYQSVLVHFLDASMWDVLQHHCDRLQILVWVHGAEVQPLHRREYNYTTDQARAAAKIQSDQRIAFWRGLLRQVPQNLKLIFVSRYFAEEVMEDLGFRIPEESYVIIHNPIDTSLFSYVPKLAAQRMKILSIRPYASRKYANDLSVAAILELSHQPFFPELEFRLIGDGALFDETLEPLRGFDNVTIERRFLSQAEIAGMHKDYGIFLSPTRMDAQGVSRDEAMSSGMVPITNSVAAIPEFVDGACGMLVPAEDASGLARAISSLVKDEKRFLALSAAAAERVRKQSQQDMLIDREVRMFMTVPKALNEGAH